MLVFQPQTQTQIVTFLCSHKWAGLAIMGLGLGRGFGGLGRRRWVAGLAGCPGRWWKALCPVGQLKGEGLGWSGWSCGPVVQSKRECLGLRVYKLKTQETQQPCTKTSNFHRIPKIHQILKKKKGNQLNTIKPPKN